MRPTQTVHEGTDHTGKVIIVTGACGDIGRAIVATLRARGATVVASDVLTSEDAAKILRDHDMSYVRGDARQPSEIDNIVAKATTWHGHIDGLVATAGIGHWATALELTVEDWDRVLSINLRGAFLAAQAAARVMVDHGTQGAIVMIGSWIGAAAARNLLPYCVSKAGLEMVARGLGLELGEHGIRVNVVAPGVVDAGVSAQIFNDVPARRHAMEAVIPLGCLGNAAQVAEATSFLLSDRAGYVTGTTLIVDGGIRLAHAGG